MPAERPASERRRGSAVHVRHRRTVSQGSRPGTAISAACSPACSARCATADRTRRASPSTARETPGSVKLTLRGASRRSTLEPLLQQLAQGRRQPCRASAARYAHGRHGAGRAGSARCARSLRAVAPDVSVVGAGRRMEIFKEVGRPERVAARFGLDAHAGHARHRPHPHGDRIRRDDRRRASRSPPAPTSASCTTARCPTTTRCARDADPRAAERFQTENDTEVAAGYLTWRMREGASLERGARSARSTISTASTPSWSAPRSASPCCAIRSPASRP